MIASREQTNIEAIRGLLKESSEQPNIGAVRVGEKILLNLSECRSLTGLSDNNLREAIKEKKLKAKIIGRGYKIKRSDSDEFVKKL